MKKQYYLTFILCMVMTSLQAQTNLPPIQLDRPDLTESPFITPTNYLQVEAGLLYEIEENGIGIFTSPTVLTKYGVHDKFEIRLITEYVTTDHAVRKPLQGITPIWVGFKTHLLTEKGIIPQTSFIGHIAIPSLASSDYQANYLAPQFRFTMQHTLSKSVTLGYNLGVEWDGFSAREKYIYTITSGISLHKKWGCFIELFGEGEKGIGFKHNVDAGFTYLVNNNSMLDISSGLNWQEQTYFVSFGYSFRLNMGKKKK